MQMGNYRLGEYDEGYLNLANAIIEQAVLDLKWSIDKRRKGDETIQSQRMMSDTLQFFGSDYFSLLSNVDPMVILKEVISDETK